MADASMDLVHVGEIWDGAPLRFRKRSLVSGQVVRAGMPHMSLSWTDTTRYCICKVNLLCNALFILDEIVSSEPCRRAWYYGKIN
jgi:hypothetical protein